MISVNEGEGITTNKFPVTNVVSSYDGVPVTSLKETKKKWFLGNKWSKRSGRKVPLQSRFDISEDPSVESHLGDFESFLNWKQARIG